MDDPTATHGPHQTDGDKFVSVDIDIPIIKAQVPQLSERAGSISQTLRNQGPGRKSIDATDGPSKSTSISGPSSSTSLTSKTPSSPLTSKSKKTTTQDHISLTRPRNLPPKPIEEDRRHLSLHLSLQQESQRRLLVQRRKEDGMRKRRDDVRRGSMEGWLRFINQAQNQSVPFNSMLDGDGDIVRLLFGEGGGCPPILRGRIWNLAVFGTLNQECHRMRRMFHELLAQLDTIVHGTADDQNDETKLHAKNDGIVGRKRRGTGDSIVCDQIEIIRHDIHNSLLSLPDTTSTTTANSSNQSSDPDDEERRSKIVESLRMIELDAYRTFPALKLFQQDAPYHLPLIQVLQAHSLYNPQMGYVQGMSFHAAMLLINMDAADAFAILSHTLSQPLFKSFFLVDEREISHYFIVFRMFFGQFLPELYLHFVQCDVDIGVVLMEWFLSLYSRCLPVGIAMRIWDAYFVIGESILYRAGLGILKILQGRLMSGGFEHVVYLLTHLPLQDGDSDSLFQCMQDIDISHERYLKLLASIKK